MAAVLSPARPAVEAGPAGSVAPTAPRSPALPPEPVDPRPRYWDHGAAAWRPCPVRDGAGAAPPRDPGATPRSAEG